MARVLRTELRRSTALAAGVILVVVTTASVFALSGPWWKGSGAWDQQWTGLAQWLRYLLQFAWPVILAIGALQGLRERRSGIEELLCTTARPRWHRVTVTAGAVASVLATAYVLIVSVGAVRVVGNTSYVHLKWLPIAVVEVLALVAGAVLGMGIGRLVPSVLTPPLLGLTGLATIIVLQSTVGSGMATGALVTPKTSLLSPALTTIPGDAFSTVAVRVSLAQIGWFLALAVAGMVLLIVQSRVRRMLAVLPVVVGGVLALAALPSDSSMVYLPDPDASDLICTADAPKVCVSRAHRTSLDELVGPARDGLAVLRQLPHPPTRVEETRGPTGLSVRQGRRNPDVVLVDFDDTAFSRMGRGLRDGDDLRESMLAGAGTLMCGPMNGARDDIRRELIARTVAAAWLTGDVRSLPGYEYLWSDIQEPVMQTWLVLRDLPRGEQRDRVSALRTAELDCQGDPLDLLLRGARR